MLKRVLLAYARWNKNIGYCQGLFKIVQLFVYLLECENIFYYIMQVLTCWLL